MYKGNRAYSLMNTPARRPSPTRRPENLHWEAPACMFSKGLPLLFDLCVDCAVAPDDDAP